MAERAAEFTIVEEFVADVDKDPSHHLVDYETQRFVTELWSAYLARVRAGLSEGPVHPAMRRVSYSLDGEAFPGQQLVRGIRMDSRSRRSCTFAIALWHPDGRLVHSAEMVTVFVDPQLASAVEIPEDFWEAVEVLEGREIRPPASTA
jgi:acyl-CoA thioesterase FadM